VVFHNNRNLEKLHNLVDKLQISSHDYNDSAADKNGVFGKTIPRHSNIVGNNFSDYSRISGVGVGQPVFPAPVSWERLEEPAAENGMVSDENLYLELGHLSKKPLPE